MRKIIVSINVTLDGFIAGPDCELDWHFNFWNEEMADYACEQLSHADAIILGRETYSGMAKYWQSVTMDQSYPRADIAFADMMNNYQKIVFSKTLEKTEWNNSKLVHRNIKGEIKKLKEAAGKDMIIYGSGKVVTALTKMGLIDDYVLWLHPVILGKGKTLFERPGKWPSLKLLHTKNFESGVVILHYAAKG